MRSWIVDRWLHVRASYWFIPSLMVIGALVAATVMVSIDGRVGQDWLQSQGWLYLNQPDGARALLSTVAGSMITVAGVTFSMTLLAVSHASAQIGPQLMTRFMQDRGNQFTLGTFIATFLYCLMVLRTVHAGVEGQEQSVFVPHLAVLFAVGLTLLSVMVLIYFIHHVPQTISVAKVISRVGDELVESVTRLYPTQVGEGASEVGSQASLPSDFHARSKRLTMKKAAGFLRVLDTDSLMSIAHEHDLVMELHQRPGDFAIEDSPVMSVYPANQLDDDVECKLLGCFSWGSERTQDQDILFVVEQLLEVLGKAMSPGINGQYTALLCMNQFERALAEALKREGPDARRFDEEGTLRAVAQPITHEELVHAVFRPIFQFVQGDWIATQHLLKILERLQSQPGCERAMPLLAVEAERLRAALQEKPS